MALSQQEVVALVAGGAVITGAILIARRPLPVEPVEPLFAVTGPSESTAREIIRAGVESQRIEATFGRDIADISTRGLVDLTRLDVQERITGMELRTRERISLEEQLSRREIAKIAGETQRFVSQTQANVQQAAVAAQQQKGIFDTILDIGKILLPFFF